MDKSRFKNADPKAKKAKVSAPKADESKLDKD